MLAVRGRESYGECRMVCVVGGKEQVLRDGRRAGGSSDPGLASGWVCIPARRGRAWIDSNPGGPAAEHVPFPTLSVLNRIPSQFVLTEST